MQILGSKKGASQPQKPHIAKDDLISTDYYKGLYGICEGEIEGLADGGKSIKLDGTPLINANGQPNFKGVTWDFRAGTLDQSHISGFPAVENEQNIGVELRHDRPYTKAITNKELSAVRVRLNLNALREQKDNGDIVGYAIEYAIDLQTDTGAFVEVLRQPIRGKASNGFKRSHRIDLPPAKKGWTIRIRRITPNRDSDLVADTMTVDAITEIIDAKLAYPCTALLGLTYDAKTFNNIAKLAVRLKGKIIQVPTNYNPQTRQYTGLWDGTFKMAYSNNPAWVFYDLCTHRRYGLGERLAGLVDKWRLYQIGQYCDELVDDGKGGQEPRFTVNVYIQKADDAYRVLQNLASVFRGMSFWDGSNIVVDSDTPKEPVYTFSPANIVGGEFTYQGTRDKDRHTVAKVAWDNPDNDFKTEYEPVTDEESLATYGFKQLDINAFGCTSLGQAQRAGLWALKSEQLETRSVTFKTGLQGFIPQVGQVINIADDVFAGRAISGRIVNVNGKQITLDRVAGKIGDTLTVATADGIVSSPITAVKGEILTLKQALNVENQSVWAIVADDLKLMQFRILTIEQHDDATFSIHALQYEPQKFDVVDNGVHITPQPYSVLKATPITAPNSVTLTASSRTVQGQAVTTLTINWEQVQGATAYLVKWRKDDGNWQTLPKISGQSVDIDSVYAGKYLAQVQAVDSFDNESLPATSILTTINGKVGKPPRLAKFAVKGILFGMELNWAFARGSDDTNFTEIQVSPDGRSNIASLGTFSYPTNSHTINGLQGNLTQFYRARIVDKMGNTSDWTAWTKGVTDSSADKVLDLLNGQITQSQLHQDLATPIEKIPTLETGITAISGKLPTLENSIASINGQLPTLNGQIATLSGKATTLQNELNTAKNTLQTAVANITTERNRINTAIRDISALQTANNAKTQEIANLTQTVGGHTSSIRELGVTTGDLSQKYTALKTATDTANSEITAVKQTQSGQATSIERLGAKFDNLAVGGRNLILNSKQILTVPAGGAENRENQQIRMSVATIDWVTVKQLTLSVDVKHADDLARAGNRWYRIALELLVSHTDGTKSYPKAMITAPVTTAFHGRISYVWDIPREIRNIDYAVIFVQNIASANDIIIANPKLEIGNIATDWTPAPEDLQADIDSKATTANLDNLRQTLTNADTALSQQITALDTAYKSADRQLTANLASEQIARTSADTALGQRIDSLQSDYNGNKASVASQLKTLSDKDTATASQISQLTANVSTAQQTANTANGKADTATTKADNAQNTANNALNRANTANSAITAEQKARADADSSLASQITALDTAYKSADSQLSGRITNAQQTATNAQNAVASVQSELTAKFDSLAVGGRNLLKNSSPNVANANYLQRFELTQSPSVGDDVIVTLWGDMGADRTGIGVYNTQGFTELFRLVKIADGIYQGKGQWRKPVRSGQELTPNDTHLNVYFYPNSATSQNRIDKIKLEKGNVATDWTPAPEDTQSQLDEKASTASLNEFKQASANANMALGERITAIDTAYKQADTATNAKLANAEKAISDNNTALSQRITALDTAYKSADNNLTARLAREETARASGDNANSQAIRTLESTVSGIGGRIGISESKIATLERTTSDTNQALATAQSQLNARFDNLAVGGRNLILNSKQILTVPAGGAENRESQQIRMSVANIDWVTVKQLTLSVDVKHADDLVRAGNRWYRIALELSVSHTDGTKSYPKAMITAPVTTAFHGRIRYVWDVPREIRNIDYAVIFVQNIASANDIIIANPKLEIGNIATDWTPAPEDVQADIDSKATTANLDNFRQTLTNADTALSQQITAMDTAYKSADRTLTANLAGETTARTSADTALGQRIDSLQSDYNGNKASVANQLKTLSDKDTATASQISQLTANVSTAQQTANTANGKADTATTKADNAQRTANDAVSRANTANSAITAEQKARADADTALGQRITAIDTAYKSADSQTVAKLGQIEQSISDKDRAMSQRVDTLTANFTTLDNHTKWAELTAVTDLNTLTETGKYFIKNTNNPNSPTPPHWLFVEVDKGTNERIKQTVIQDNNVKNQWVRHCLGGNWGQWEKVATGSDLNQKADAVALNSLTTKVNQVDGKITAEAQKISTLQTTVNGQTTSIQQQATSIDGLKAQYTVKIDSGGRVSGFGLASGGGVSDFSVRADKFLIAPPSGNGKGDSPFMVLTTPTNINGTVVPSGTYIKSAYIANGAIDNLKVKDGAIGTAKIAEASITTAKIMDLAVDTIKIQDRAVTVPHTFTDTNPRNFENKRFDSFEKSETGRTIPEISEWVLHGLTPNTEIMVIVDVGRLSMFIRRPDNIAYSKDYDCAVRLGVGYMTALRPDDWDILNHSQALPTLIAHPHQGYPMPIASSTTATQLSGAFFRRLTVPEDGTVDLNLWCATYGSVDDRTIITAKTDKVTWYVLELKK